MRVSTARPLSATITHTFTYYRARVHDSQTLADIRSVSETGVLRNNHNGLLTRMKRNSARQASAADKVKVTAERAEERTLLDKELDDLKQKTAELKERRKTVVAQSGGKRAQKKTPAYSVAGDSSGRAPKTMAKAKGKDMAAAGLDAGE